MSRRRPVAPRAPHRLGGASGARIRATRPHRSSSSRDRPVRSSIAGWCTRKRRAARAPTTALDSARVISPFWSTLDWSPEYAAVHRIAPGDTDDGTRRSRRTGNRSSRRFARLRFARISRVCIRRCAVGESPVKLHCRRSSHTLRPYATMSASHMTAPARFVSMPSRWCNARTRAAPARSPKQHGGASPDRELRIAGTARSGRRTLHRELLTVRIR